MIIRDKQDLRKCVKQSVRRCEVIETDFRFDIAFGECGIAPMLGVQEGAETSLNEVYAQRCSGLLLDAHHAALIAALDAMQLPVHDLDKAHAIASGYDRNAYLSALLSAMRARRVLVRVQSEDAALFAASDARFAPLLVAEDALFAPERYGVPYGRIAEELVQAARMTNARDLTVERFDAQALAYCILPVCEDQALVLHLHLHTEDEIDTALALLREHGEVHALLSASQSCMKELMIKARGMHHVLIRLNEPGMLQEAIAILGSHFLFCASSAERPEEMLGRWVLAREALWPALCDAYLPLARSGFELTRERIEADIEMLLCGNFEKLYQL